VRSEPSCSSYVPPNTEALRLAQGCTSDPVTVQGEANVFNTLRQRGAGVTESDGGREPDHVLCIGLAARPRPSLSAPERQDHG